MSAVGSWDVKCLPQDPASNDVRGSSGEGGGARMWGAPVLNSAPWSERERVTAN